MMITQPPAIIEYVVSPPAICSLAPIGFKFPTDADNMVALKLCQDQVPAGLIGAELVSSKYNTIDMGSEFVYCLVEVTCISYKE